MGFEPTRLKVQIKLAINRLKMLQLKKANQNAVARKEIARLLEKSKDESARIKVEQIIREDYMMEALELIELFCDLLLARFGMLESMKYCDDSILEAVATLIWVAPRVSTDVQELNEIRSQLISKYGKEFAASCMDDKKPLEGGPVVSPRIIKKFSVQAPPEILVNQYLQEIARACNVDWSPPVDNSQFSEDHRQLIDLDGPGVGTLSFATSGGFSVVPPFGAQPQNPPSFSHPFPMPPTGGNPNLNNNKFLADIPPPLQSFSPYPPQQPQQQYPPSISSQQFPPPPTSSTAGGFGGGGGGAAGAAGGGATSGLPEYSSGMPDFPSVPSTLPGQNRGGGGGSGSGSGGGSGVTPSGSGSTPDDPDFDILARRFEALKKR